MVSINLSNLPDTWKWVKLSEISKINPTLDISDIDENDEFTYIPMRCVEEETGKADISIVEKLSKLKKGYKRFIDGDIIFARITPCMENGKVAIVNNLLKGIGFGSTEFHVIRLNDELSRKFFFYYLLQKSIRKDAQRNMTGTVGHLRVPTKYMEALYVPFPPTEQQFQIVEKIEELFSKLDYGENILSIIKDKLNKYQKSVLKSAFEGKITKEWHEINIENLRTPEKLIKKTKLNQNHYLKNNNLELSNLPNKWIWTRLGDITEIASGGTPSTKDKSNFGGEIPWITPKDLSNFKGKNIFKGSRNITQKGLNSSSTKILPKGTVVFSSRAPIGYVAIAANELCTNQGCKNFIVLEGLYNEYLYYYLKGNKNLAESYASGTTFLELSAKRAAMIPIPLAPIEEQYKIVEEIEKLLSISYQIKKSIKSSLKKALNLRQSILKMAFEGKLLENEFFKQSTNEKEENQNNYSKNSNYENKSIKLKQKKLNEYVK